MRWIPNALTAARVLLIPVVVALLEASAGRPGDWDRPRIAALAVYLLLALTDWLDGFLARRFGAESTWGSVADAVADRLAILVPLAYLALREADGFPLVPLWIPGWLLLIDAAALGAWTRARRAAPVSPPRGHRQVGRAGAVALFLLVIAALTGAPSPAIPGLALAGLGLSTASVALYIREWISESAGGRPEQRPG